MGKAELSPLFQLEDPTQYIKYAHHYFEQTQVHLLKTDELNPNIQDKDGLVTYMVASSNPPPEEMQKLYDEVAPVMEGLTNVVVSAILKQAGGDDAKKHNPAVWRGPMEAMTKAFCGGFSQSSKHYDQTIIGVDVATKFLNILMDATINEGAALDDFRKFLKSQGDTIQTQISSSTNKYLYASVSIVHEFFKASDGRWIYVPKFKSYFTQFTQETLKITTACASYDKFKFKFDLDIMSAAFMVESWKTSSSFRDQVRKFIDKFQKINIKDSENYFDGIFNSTP